MAEKQLRRDDFWLIRPCEVYKEEYHDCKKLKSRFYQHYVHGEFEDCSQWMADFKNCMAFRHKDIHAARAVIESELVRKAQRLHAARANDVWEYRSVPPAEWSAPIEGLNQSRDKTNWEKKLS